MNFGVWKPDLPPYGHDGLVTARNVFASASGVGYEPVKEYSAVTTALTGTWNGGGSFRGVDGTVVLLAGTSTNLYSYASSTWTSEATGTYSSRWQFAQFGDLAIGVHGGAPVKYTITTGVAAALGGSPPNAKYIATVKDFVVMAGDSAAVSTVAWSAINNAEGWTAGTSQSDTQVLPDGGEITGLVGGEYLLVFQRNAIWRAQYVGVPYIFQFDKISDGIGCTSPYSIVQIGRTVYFWSQRGFMSITDGQIDPIGAETVDTTFINQYATADIESRIWAAADPERKQIIWAMPSRLWCYNWRLKRWTDVDGDFFAVSTAMTQNYTLEQIAVLFPSIEDVTPPLDDPYWSGGQPFLAIIANDGTIGSFGSETTKQATIKTAYIEYAPGRDLRFRKARLDGDVTSSAVFTVNSRQRLGDSDTLYSGSSIQSSGDIPIRGRGRYLQANISVASGTSWTWLNGVDFVGGAAGGRR